MQPGRILVIDTHASNHITHLRALGFDRRWKGGPFARAFPGGEIARAVMLTFKDKLEEAGILSHMEYVGKVFRECTMYCNSERYPHHTKQCKRRRKGK